MTGTFRLWIELGNDAMRNEQQLSEAVKAVAVRLSQGADEGKIRDANGNTVGQFSIMEDDND